MLQQTSLFMHGRHAHTAPPSPMTPELLPLPLLLLDVPLEDPLDPPLEDDVPPLEDEEAPLDDEEAPLDEPLPDPPPLELELLVAVHAVAQFSVVHVISLSPAAISAEEQPHAPMQVVTLLPRSRQPTYVAHAASWTQAHHESMQWSAMHALQAGSSVSGVHAGASEPPPLDELLASTPELLPEDPPVDASLPPPEVKALPPQSDARASGTRAKRRAAARGNRSITKPA